MQTSKNSHTPMFIATLFKIAPNMEAPCSTTDKGIKEDAVYHPAITRSNSAYKLL